MCHRGHKMYMLSIVVVAAAHVEMIFHLICHAVGVRAGEK